MIRVCETFGRFLDGEVARREIPRSARNDRGVVLASLTAVLVVALCACFPSTARAAITDDAKKEFNRGVQLTDSGKVDAAIAAYESAVKMSPDYLQAHINVGALYYKQKQLTEAATHLKAAVALDSNNAEAYRTLGLVHVQAEKYDLAIPALDRALKLEPNNGGAWASLAQARKKKGDSKGAVEAYAKAAELDPKDSRSLYNIGNVHREAGRFTEAIDAYKKAIARNPKYVEAYYNLAISSQQADLEGCVADYQAFIKVAEGNAKWKAQVAEAKDKVRKIAEYIDSKGGQ